MKCELCHKGEAKHQAFRNDGAEVYVCEKCFNKMIEAAAEAVLEEAPTEDCFEGVEKLRGEKDDPFAISIAAASTLVELRNRLGKPVRFTFNRNIEGTDVNARVRFDNIQKNITLRFSLNNAAKDDMTTDSEWVFNVTNKKAISMNAWCHFGGEHSMSEHKYRFNERNAPTQALMTLVTILGGLMSSKDELQCDFN